MTPVDYWNTVPDKEGYFKFTTSAEYFRKLSRIIQCEILGYIDPANPGVIYGLVYIAEASDIKVFFQDFISGKIIFYRNTAIMHAYLECIASDTEHYGSVSKSILQEKLQGNNRALVLNNFPIFVGVSGIKQLVLWYTDSLSLAEAENFARATLREGGESFTDILVAEFELSRKSVPGVNHYHVYVLNSLHK